jgi:hypothetical protein
MDGPSTTKPSATMDGPSTTEPSATMDGPSTTKPSATMDGPSTEETNPYETVGLLLGSADAVCTGSVDAETTDRPVTGAVVGPGAHLDARKVYASGPNAVGVHVYPGGSAKVGDVHAVGERSAVGLRFG